VDGGFLVEDPRVTFDSGDLPKIPYLLGANSDEGTLFFIGSPELTGEQYTAELLSRYGAYAPEIEALYPPAMFDTPRDALIRVFGDSTLVCSTHDVAKRYSRKRQKTYLYHFARVPPIGFIELLGLGAFHGLEISYVFGSAGSPTASDTTIGETVQGYWSSFARTGRPRLPDTLRWPRFNSRYYKTMRFNAPNAVTRQFRKAQCDFWSTVYDTGAF